MPHLRPVDEVQVQIVELQVCECLLARDLDVLRLVLTVPQFRCDEHRFSGHTTSKAFGERGTDFFFVAIACCTCVCDSTRGKARR